jgi:glycosyltransferase involved in cell wall biosynthesis
MDEVEQKLPISVCIITLNEEKNIENCLRSVRWADDIVIVDSGSADKTLEIAKRYTDRIIYNQWKGINEQRNFTLNNARYDWVLALDADEIASQELYREVKSILGSDNDYYDGYLVPRLTYYLGKWICHGGWFPDRKMRLFKKAKARYIGTNPHDHCRVDGNIGRLSGLIVHYTYKNFSEQIETINSFSNEVIKNLEKDGKRFDLFRFIFHPLWKFFECYFLKRGFLDGVPGFIIAIATAFYIFTKYVKLWEKSKGV